MPTLLSVNVGLPKDVPWQSRTVYTGVWKHPVAGPAMVRRLNIDGDGQGDLKGHGGEQRAVLVYQIQSHRHWEQHFGWPELAPGSFGENLTVDGLPDDEVCIGDRYRIGSAEFEVTQPRVTCYRVGLRLSEPELPALLVSHHRPGFYMRVITEGSVRAGDEIVRTAAGPGAVTVAEADALLYLPSRPTARLRVAAEIPALSPGWRQSFVDLLAASGTAAKPAWPAFRPLLVTSVTHENASVTSVHLSSPDGDPLPAARPGQYLALRVPATSPPLPIRSYSLSSPPGAPAYRITVKHESHGLVSGYLTTDLRAGTLLEAAAPRGEFVLEESSSPLLLLSAGIGLTPVLAMLHSLAATQSTREIWWVHGARSPAEHPLATESHALLSSLPNAHEHVFYSATSGRLTASRLSALGIPSTATAYICGPTPFMSDMQSALSAAGVPDSQIRTELFGALPATTPGITSTPTRSPHQPPGPPGTGPTVTFSRSGIAARFSPAYRGILDLADACDVPTRWSCRTGVCHTCTTPLLSGSVAYAPEPLEPPPAGEVLTCCSHPESDVVLDM
ncbi:MAG TPA: MOSC and FAD-binding oxidoreductase domain-containing protein [Dactylosporangium sp.]|nr:MOSC and FAD-binding oxidoreductase domain-containing protein [Dactylosporangium sp.]